MANYTYTNVTIPNGGYTISGAGSGYTLTAGATGSPTWVTTASSITQPSPKVKITETDILLDGVSLRETMLAIQDRLAILVPDPKKLEEFKALKEAYEHYKTLEALCCSTENTDKK